MEAFVDRVTRATTKLANGGGGSLGFIPAIRARLGFLNSSHSTGSNDFSLCSSSPVSLFILKGLYHLILLQIFQNHVNEREVGVIRGQGMNQSHTFKFL